jgi:hypothetical protein
MSNPTMTEALESGEVQSQTAATALYAPATNAKLKLSLE